MNWIRVKDTSEVVRKLFLKEIVPISKELHNKGKKFFPLNHNHSVPTYYLKREKTTMEPEDFELSGCDSYISLEKALVELWNSQGHSEILVLAQISSKLAKLLYLNEEEDEEVSPFIYVMY